MTTIQFTSLGPGGTDTVSLGSIRILKEAQKIYCFSTNGVSHAADTIAALGIDMAKVVTVEVPMSKDRSLANKVYDELAQTISQDCHDNVEVAVATEGDTGIFATTHYVMDRLQDMGVECRQTPGIPSFIAAASIAGLHLVKLRERLMIIPGNASTEEMERLIDADCNLVIMKLSMAHEAVSELMHRRTGLQYHYFENIGMPSQVYKPLTTPPDSFPYFSLMIISK